MTVFCFQLAGNKNGHLILTYPFQEDVSMQCLSWCCILFGITLGLI